jgi:putative ABC transport system permease protein
MFGLPVGVLAVVLTAMVGVGVGVIAALALRNSVFFRLGVRNVRRRQARSALIVVGLMLATAIIASALGTGDTMGRTIRSGALRALGEADEWITVKTARPSAMQALEAESVSALFDEAVTRDVDRALKGSELVDGVTPAIVDWVAVQNVTARATEPRVGVFAPDPGRLEGFGRLTYRDGRPASLGGLGPGSVFVNVQAADKLDASDGHRVAVLARGRAFEATVAGIVEFRGTGTDGAAILLPLAAAQRALGLDREVTHIFVSNRGGETSGVARTDAVVERLRPVLEPYGLEAQPVKRDRLEAADEAGNAFMQMFTTFGSFSIAAGILLIFLIFVMLAAERRTEMGVARAIGTRRGHLVQTFLFEGVFYDVVAAALGALLGIGVSLAMVGGVSHAFATDSDSLQVVWSIRPQSVVVAYMLGVLLTLAVVALSAWRVSVVNIVTAIRNLPDPRPAAQRRRSLYANGTLVALGALAAWSGRSSAQAMPFLLGASLLAIGAAGMLRAAGLPDRACYTAGGLGIVVLWLLPLRAVEWLVPGAQMDFTMWVVGGLLVVIGATWTVIYNADALLGGVTAVLGRVRALAGVVKISMAYPLRARLRTGMTLAMFTLVVYTLVVGTTTTSAFLDAFGRVEQFSGGFDVRAVTSPLSPLDDAAGALRRAPGIDAAEVRTVGSQSSLPVEVRQAGTERARYVDYVLRGVDDAFAAATTFRFAARADGYGSDAAVWEALRTRRDLAVIDASSVLHRRNWNFGSLSELKLRGFYVEDRTFAPVSLDVRDPASGRVLRLTVIGVLFESAPFEMYGVTTSQESLAPLGPRAKPTAHYVQLAGGVDAARFADDLESAFLAHGLVAESYAEVVRESVAASLVMNRLILGFMALGLVVGVAALGVIAARSVVERRQQIGVLRAIGLQASAVRLGFLLEAGFLAATAIGVGAALGLATAFNVIDDASRQANYGTVPFAVPWGVLAAIFAVVLLVALATTYLPARRASRVYAAEALRYQ